MDTTSEQQTTTWLGGLPYLGDRPMSDEERATIERLRKRAGRKIVLSLAVTPVMIGLTIFSLLKLTLLSPLPFVLMMVTFATPAVSYLGTRDALRQIRGFKSDLLAGVISRFGYVEGTDAVAAKLVETLPVSERLWTIDGAFQQKWVVARRSEVATAPEYAALAAEWVQPVDSAPPDAPYYNQRELSVNERDELRRHIRRIRFSRLPITLILDIWLISSFLTSWLAATPEKPFRWEPIAPFFVVLVAASNWLFIKQWKIASVLARDMAFGKVFIARLPKDVDGTVTLSEAMEYLPNSRMYWSIGGRPAGWRLTPRRSKPGK